MLARMCGSVCCAVVVCCVLCQCEGLQSRDGLSMLINTHSLKTLVNNLGSHKALSSKLPSNNNNNDTETADQFPTLLRHPRLHRFKRALKTAASRLPIPASHQPQNVLQKTATTFATKEISLNISAADNHTFDIGSSFIEEHSTDFASENQVEGSRTKVQRDIASRVSEGMCQRQLVAQLKDGVWRDIRDTLQETILSQVTTEGVVEDIIIPIGECIAYGIVHELADTVAQRFLSQFEGAIQSVIPDGIQLLFGPLLALYLMKGLGRTMAISISDPLQVFLNRDLVEIVTVQFMGYLSSQGDPQLSHAVTHVVSDVVVKGVVQAVTHTLTHGITHAVTHTTTHEVIHQYYCIYCHYYNEYCDQCYHYVDDPNLHRLFQVTVAD
eukprot:c11850_g2_i1.p1 GENE.c11850_g2_i1~~c11850_g2_i1.p1  ORF type:complete len:383 (-),score=110.65 c11850_g2_i1:79-1227(-)